MLYWIENMLLLLFFFSFKTSLCFSCSLPIEKQQGIHFFLIQELIITLILPPCGRLQSLAAVFVYACFEMIVAILYHQASKLYSSKLARLISSSFLLVLGVGIMRPWFLWPLCAFWIFTLFPFPTIKLFLFYGEMTLSAYHLSSSSQI